MTRTRTIGTALLGTTILLSAGLLAQETERQFSAEEQAMMEAWTKYMTPGEPHEHLTARAGKWDIAVKIWHPGAPYPEESVATSTIKPILGGRFIMEKIEGEAMGEPFHGLGIAGFDNMKQKFVSVWMDTMGTGILPYEGKRVDADTLRFTGVHPNPLEGTYEESRSIEKKISDDKYLYTAYHTMPDGTEYKSMELVYTRATK